MATASACAPVSHTLNQGSRPHVTEMNIVLYPRSVCVGTMMMGVDDKDHVDDNNEAIMILLLRAPRTGPIA